jgi:hypothetical protein
LKTLFLLLFYAKTILLTQEITISNKWVEIYPKKTFTAITSGASIEIGIANSLPNDKNISITNNDFIYKFFPPKSIEGEIVTSENEIIKIQYKGGISYGGKNDIRLMLTPKKSMPTNKSFIKLRLKSKNIMKSVKVYWRNFTL